MQVRQPFRSLANLVVHRAPIEAELIVTRRCNLSCGYCTEYDKVSGMIPLETLQQRIDALHRLRVINISLLGGEPLLHPDLPAVVVYANRKSQVSITTNAFLLTEDLIRALNRAGLANMQLSVDGVLPDRTAYIQKCLKTIRPKLALLQRLAEFDVHVNLVLCEQTKEHFTEAVRELVALGIQVSIGLLHDAHGTIAIAGDDYVRLWQRYYREAAAFSYVEEDYGAALLARQRPAWHCRAGSRSIYVDEFGNTQFCSAQRGKLGKAVLEYSAEDLRAHSETRKDCEAGCSLLCHFRASAVDNDPLGSLVSLARVTTRRTRKVDAKAPPLVVRPALPA